jgi:hypothetical protein
VKGEWQMLLSLPLFTPHSPLPTPYKVGEPCMPILTQCTSCNRKLRVQDHLLGKTVKCPGCQAKFLAQPIEESAPQLTPIGPPPLPPPAEESQQTPIVLPPNAELATPSVQTLELAEAAPQAPAPEPRSSERLAAVAAAPPPEPAPPPTPPAPPPFPTPALKVFAFLGAILLLTTIVGLGFSGWLAFAVQRAIEARQ